MPDLTKRQPLHKSWLGFQRPHQMVTFSAWRVGESGQAWPLDIGMPCDLAEAQANATVGSGLSHKDTLLIHERDEARERGTLRSFSVVKKAAIWRKNDQTGVPERFEPLALKPGFSMAIPVFEPEPPFDALEAPRRAGG